MTQHSAKTDHISADVAPMGDHLAYQKNTVHCHVTVDSKAKSFEAEIPWIDDDFVELVQSSLVVVDQTA